MQYNYNLFTAENFQVTSMNAGFGKLPNDSITIF